MDVLVELLPFDANIQLCLSCHEFDSDGSYGFEEPRGVFPRPLVQRPASMQGELPGFTPIKRTEIVLCTRDELLWTSSRPRNRGGVVRQDVVTLYSVPFSEIVGASVHNRRKGTVDVWIGDDATLSFGVAPSEADSLCAYIEQAATSE